jgi:hypothetical protein
MHQKGPVSVLVAPLDWGLGHATRCVPIIRALIQQGIEVVVAASGAQKTLLKEEFPGLEYLDIPGYGINYRPGVFLKWAILWRIPAILKQIQRENKWLDELLKQRQIDAVISDNRYGLYHEKLFCVFITHQLAVRSGWGRLIDRVLLKWNYRFINRFSVCWVPDLPGDYSLAGKLSHPPFLPVVPLKYIGWLSRLQPSEARLENKSILLLLSGPEPERTRFEKILFAELARFAGKAVVIRGLPGSAHPAPFIREGISINNHLPLHDLNEQLNHAEIIITRSGYSTIMDLVQVRRKAVVVPTPGQTEQEYLGTYLHKRKWMYCVKQKNFELELVLQKFKQEELTLPEISGISLLEQVLAEFIKEIGYSGL